MLVNRVALEIGDALVEREQYPIGIQGCIHNCRICRTAKSFADHLSTSWPKPRRSGTSSTGRFPSSLNFTLPETARDALRVPILLRRPERH